MYSTYSSSDFYICENFVQCCLHKLTIIDALLQVNLLAHFFTNDTEILEYFHDLQDICFIYHQYIKMIRFLICHSSEIVNLYM